MELTAHAERSGDWWALSVPEVRGLHSQCKRLEQAEAMVKDAAALYFDRPASDFTVTVVPRVEGVAVEALRSDSDLARRALREAELVAATTSRVAVDALRGAGLPVRDVATILGISHQRVAQLAAKKDSGGQVVVPKDGAKVRGRRDRHVR